MKLVFDIGMYDGSDTEYYLSEGYKVVSVEANPGLIEKAKKRFKKQVSSGQLVLINKAICGNSGEEKTLAISSDDLGSSSIIEGKIADENQNGYYKICGIALLDLIHEFGLPYFMKIDIEGADRHCILPLNEQNRPQYISFEAGDDIKELIEHLKKIGYKKFKAINQCNFNELNNQESLIFRAKRKIINLLGFDSPRYVKRKGRFFLLEHSAGPAPWASDGEWQDASTLLEKWNILFSNNELGGWYDIHVMK